MDGSSVFIVSLTSRIAVTTCILTGICECTLLLTANLPTELADPKLGKYYLRKAFKRRIYLNILPGLFFWIYPKNIFNGGRKRARNSLDLSKL